IIYPNDQFFIEKNIIQKSIHVFKKHPNRLGYGLCCYFHFKTSGNLEFIIAFAIVAIFALIVIGLYWLFSGYFENLWQSFV
ncbi:hypothetical protein, partial [Ruminobacter sp.]|uniref:hypothetical protein n=1 Tax=Ruminobacter sp. TaxID=2774296 RepID=UPI003866C1B3